MKRYDVFELVSHLRKCPDIFLKASDFIVINGLNSKALVFDTYRTVSNDFLSNDFKFPTENEIIIIEDNHWRAIHISNWLMHHQDFVNNLKIINKLYKFWFQELCYVSEYVKYRKWIDDEERAEEMVRLLLKCCEIIPNGESLDEAEDKFSSLSSVDRQKVLRASYDANERIMKIKREMAAKKAREAANAYGRE